MKFTFFTGDGDYLTYGGKWISGKQNNGDFDYWLVRNLVPTAEIGDYEGTNKYLMELAVVAPDEFAEGRDMEKYVVDAYGQEYAWENSWETMGNADRVELVYCSFFITHSCPKLNKVS